MKTYIIHYEDLSYDDGYVGYVYVTGENIQDTINQFIQDYPTRLVDSIEEKI